MVKTRNIAFCILASIFTCGIYNLFWIVSITDDISEISQDRRMPSGITVLLLNVVTCGIYGIYWAYKMGEKIDEINQRRGGPATSNSGIIYLVLSILGLTRIIIYAIIQDQINKFIDNDMFTQNQINKFVDNNE